MSSRLIHAVASISALFHCQITPHHMDTPYHLLFICSSATGHLGCFHFLAIMNRAAIKRSCTSICLNTCFQVFWINTWEWKWWAHGNSGKLFEELANCFPKHLHHFTFPPAVCEGPGLSTPLGHSISDCFHSRHLGRF